MPSTRQALVSCINRVSDYRITLREEQPNSAILWFVGDDEGVEPEVLEEMREQGYYPSYAIATISGDEAITAIASKSHCGVHNLLSQFAWLIESAIGGGTETSNMDLDLRPNGALIDIDVIAHQYDWSAAEDDRDSAMQLGEGTVPICIGQFSYHPDQRQITVRS